MATAASSSASTSASGKVFNPKARIRLQLRTNFEKLTAAKNKHGENTLNDEIAESYYQIALSYLALGNEENLSKSLEYSFKALNMWKYLYGTEQIPRIYYLYMIVGRNYMLRKYFQLSLDHFHRALTLAEQMIDNPHDSLIYSVIWAIGEVHFRKGDYENARKLFKESQQMHASEKGPERGKAGFHNRLGHAYRKLRRYEDAMEAYNTALQIYETIEVPVDKLPSVAFCHQNIGNVHRDYRQYNEAEQHYKQAIADLEKLLKGRTSHPSLDQLYTSLGIVYHEQNRFQQALEQFSKSEALLKMIYGKDEEEPVERPDIDGQYESIASRDGRGYAYDLVAEDDVFWQS